LLFRIIVSSVREGTRARHSHFLCCSFVSTSHPPFSNICLYAPTLYPCKLYVVCVESWVDADVGRRAYNLMRFLYMEAIHVKILHPNLCPSFALYQLSNSNQGKECKMLMCKTKHCNKKRCMDNINVN